MNRDDSRGVPASDAGSSAFDEHIREDGVAAPEAQHMLENLRAELAAEIRGRQDDRTTARQSLNRAQDLNAELFRLRDQLTMVRLQVEESGARILDLEAQVGVRGAQCEVLTKDLAERTLQLSQAMTLHQHDAVRWDGLLDLARQTHQQEIAEASRRIQIECDLEFTKARALGDLALTEARAHANANASTLREVLSSRSWRLTKPMRRLAAWARGQRWAEPEMPGAPSVAGPRAADEHRDE